MTDLREKVEAAIYAAIPREAFGWGDMVVNGQRIAAIEGDVNTYLLADAAIKAVLEGLKDPSEDMLEAGEKAAWDDNAHMPMHRAMEHGYVAMIQAFTRDHYLSLLAEEDGKEL